MAPLQRLLEALDFDPGRDRLWCTGDLVNRGPDSLAVLRFVKGLGSRAVTVLGNHDLHLLAVAAGVTPMRPADTFGPVLEAPDREALLSWLRHRPLLHQDEELGYTLIHAGLPPSWTVAEAREHAAEVESILRSDRHAAFFAQMYGNQPDRWRPDLKGWDRLRFITNSLTRMRFCDGSGRLDLNCKAAPGQQPDGLLPWFAIPGRRSAEQRLIFGHWAALGGGDFGSVLGLDTGCLWGGQLSAVRIDVPERPWTQIPCVRYGPAV